MTKKDNSSSRKEQCKQSKPIQPQNPENTINSTETWEQTQNDAKRQVRDVLDEVIMNLLQKREEMAAANGYFGNDYPARNSAANNNRQRSRHTCDTDFREADGRGSERGMQDEEKTDENRLRKAIRDWTRKTSFRDFYNEISKSVIGQEELKTVLASVYGYLTCIGNHKSHRSNSIIAAPSGCGKTETFRAICKYFSKEIPELVIYQYDMTSLTTEGFRGNDTHNVIDPLLKKQQYNGIGIVFFDEFDKKMISSYTSYGTDVNAEVRSQILTLVEGTKYTHEASRTCSMTIDTSNTLFLALGAFTQFRKERGEEAAYRTAGFLSDKNEVSEDEIHYMPLTRENMVKDNQAYELLGRFPHIINYRPLGKEAVDMIIEKLNRTASASVGIKIVLSDETRAALFKLANGKFGCRLIESSILDSAYPSYIRFLEGDETDPSQVQIFIDELGKSHLEFQTADDEDDPFHG